MSGNISSNNFWASDAPKTWHWTFKKLSYLTKFSKKLSFDMRWKGIFGYWLIVGKGVKLPLLFLDLENSNNQYGPYSLFDACMIQTLGIILFCRIQKISAHNLNKDWLFKFGINVYSRCNWEWTCFGLTLERSEIGSKNFFGSKWSRNHVRWNLLYFIEIMVCFCRWKDFNKLSN